MTKAELQRLKEIEASTRDLYRNHGDDIENGRFLRLSVRVIQENKWLCEQLRKALGIKRAKALEAEAEIETEEEEAAPEVAAKA